MLYLGSATESRKMTKPDYFSLWNESENGGLPVIEAVAVAFAVNYSSDAVAVVVTSGGIGTQKKILLKRDRAWTSNSAFRGQSSA